LGLKKRPTADPIIFSMQLTMRPYFLRVVAGCSITACQDGVCCHTKYWTKLPKFVHRIYASLVNIDVGTLLKIAQQKTAKNHEKNIQKKFISDLPTLIFSWYETGTTGIFFRHSSVSHKFN
jgi:hypothetical protein